MRKVLLLIICFGLFSNVWAKNKSELEINFGYKDLDLRKALKEANEKFTYLGKSIHPGLLREFLTWVSDGVPPITITIDVSAASGTNEYYLPVEIVKTAPHDQSKSVYPDDDSKFDLEYVITGDHFTFGYVWLGRLKNGLHVVKALEGFRGSKPGGGTMIREDIIFVNFEMGQGYKPDGKPYDQLLMSVVRIYPLGDRPYTMIKVYKEKNKVVIVESKYLNKPYVLEFKPGNQK